MGGDGGVSPPMAIISQYINIPNHHTDYLKLTQCNKHDNYISINLETK